MRGTLFSAHWYKASSGARKVRPMSVRAFSTRGNVYAAPSPMAAFDHQETFLRDGFGFIGIEQVDIVRAGGVAFGAEPRKQALEQVNALSA
jgi:FMN-dependent NADH-azoreductase